MQEVREVYLIVTVKVANLRAQPSTRARVVGRAIAGVLLLERGEDWYKIRASSGHEGWIAGGLVREVEVVKKVLLPAGEPAMPTP